MNRIPTVTKVEIYPVAGTVGMQYRIPGWKFDPKKPCLVRK